MFVNRILLADACVKRKEKKYCRCDIFRSRICAARRSKAKGRHFAKGFHLERKNKATEAAQRQKITTVPEIAKRQK